jgi:hypothetical protein
MPGTMVDMDHDTSANDTWSLGALVILLVGVMFAMCAGFVLLVGTIPTAPSSGEQVSATTSEGCREIWLDWDDRTWRSREFPDAWGPGTTHTGEMTERGQDVAALVTDSGQATFVAGEVFTDDCPLYLDALDGGS